MIPISITSAGTRASSCGAAVLATLAAIASVITLATAVAGCAPEARSFARTDAILYGDIASLQIAGVTGFFEGAADLELRSETRGLTVATYTAWADQPGAEGIGFGAFDASFLKSLSAADRKP
jgi:hypothetical protein